MYFLPRKSEQPTAYQCAPEGLLDPLLPVPRKQFGKFLCHSTVLFALLFQGTLSALTQR